MNTSTTSSFRPTAPVPKIFSTTAGYYGAFLMLGLAAAVLGPTLPGLATQTRTTISQISIVFSARSFGYLLGAFLGGRLFDRFPGHPILAVVLGLMAIIIAAVPFLSSLWFLTLFILPLGIIEGVIEIGGNTLLVWLHKENTGPFMNGLHFFFGIGAFLSPLIAGQVLLHTGEIRWTIGF